MAAVDDRIELEALLFQIHHVFLPPELPQKDDTNVSHEKTLVETVYLALQDFQQYFPVDHQRPELEHCIAMINSMIHTRDVNGLLDPEAVEERMVNLNNFGILAIHLRHQNAGLLIMKVDDLYFFEAMELLAPDVEVMSNKGRLKRQFPDRSIAVKSSHVQDPMFRQALIGVLVKLDREIDFSRRSDIDSTQYMKTSVPGYYFVDGIDTMQTQEPDTSDPRLVTEMLVGVLRGLSHGRDTKFPHIFKHTREEVLLHSGHLAWRRSALWLFIRVSLQLVLTRLGEKLNPTGQPQSLYKDFMLFLMSYILNNPGLIRDGSPAIPHDVMFVMMAKISRRAVKYGKPQERPWFEYTERVMKHINSIIQAKWKDVQESEAEPLDFTALGALDFQKDSQLKLAYLQPYLEERRLYSITTDAPKSKDDYGPTFERNSKDRLSRGVSTQNDEFLFFKLADFEHSVDVLLGSY